MVGAVGQNHKTKASSLKQRVKKETQVISEDILLLKVYVQIDCKIRGKETPRTIKRVRNMFKCKENITLHIKKYDKRVVIKDTVLAEDKSAIVLIEETIKIFWVKNKEYKPKA